MEFINGKAPTVPNAGNPADVVAVALAVWNRRKQTAADTGKKLQQTPFTVKTADGKQAWLVRPRIGGLEIYVRAPFGVEFTQPVAPVETRIVGIAEKPAAEKPAKPARKRKPANK